MEKDSEKNAVDKMHELNRRVLQDPANKLTIIQEFYASQVEGKDKEGADLTLLVRSIVTARETEDKDQAHVMPLFKKVGFWAALIPAIAAIIVGYWQYVYKPSHSDSVHSQLLVFVHNSRTQTPVVSAKVVMQSQGGQKEQRTDSLGTAHFDVAESDGSSWRIYVSADGYEARNVQVDISAAKSGVEVFLEPPRATITTGIDKDTRRRDSINGTWEAVTTGDVNNARIKKGTFDFALQHDRSLITTANFSADDMDVRLSGKATLQGDRLSVAFNAANNFGGSWSGQADFTLVSANRLSGRVQSKRGDDIPVTLDKVH